MPVNSLNSNRDKRLMSGKVRESQIPSVHREKRFWTEPRPFKRDYPDFEDDREGEDYYRKQYGSITVASIRDFTMKFTFTTDSAKAAPSEMKK